MEAALEPHQRMVAGKVSVNELMTTQLVALPPVVHLRELVDTLRKVRHQTFPVTNDIKKAYESCKPPLPHFLLFLEVLRTS